MIRNFYPIDAYHLVKSDMFILRHTLQKIKQKTAKSKEKAASVFKKFYNQLIDSINLEELECTCGAHNWSFHSPYERTYTFRSFKLKVKITRIICNECGKTHALLIEDMIPYSTLSYDEITIEISITPDTTLESSHHYFILHKYRVITPYEAMCIVNKRNCFLGFIYLSKQARSPG